MISLDAISAKIDAVTRDGVQEMADTLYDEERFTTVIFHPDGKRNR